jgi:hypothetical protein
MSIIKNLVKDITRAGSEEEVAVLEVTRPLPFEVILYDKEPVEIQNPGTGATCMLEPDAVAVYDTIKGSEITQNYTKMNKGLEWFREYFPEEYMVLLD